LFHGYNRLQERAQPIFHLHVRKQRGECEFYEVLLLVQASEEIPEKMNVLDKKPSQKLFVVIQLFLPDNQSPFFLVNMFGYAVEDCKL